MASPTLDRETILHTVQAWPPDEQLALAQEIARQATQAISQIAAQSETEQPTPIIPQRPSWREMADLAAVPGQEPPTDEQLAQWLDEHRMEKYGAS
jgi:hypothetical protein